MDHVYYWPHSLNFPYDKNIVGGIADEDFWREIVGCYLCRSGFDSYYRQRYPQTQSSLFWDEVELFLEDNHLTIIHIANYFRAKVVLMTGWCGKAGRESFEKEFSHVVCHFLICHKCSAMYDNVSERVVQVNSKVEEVFNSTVPKAFQ